MSVPARVGRYRILGELGRGAMGTVFRASDESLDREVALKVMSAGLVDAEARVRFQREARAAARLQHPNIVVVYEFGEHEGAPFMALELLEGVDLAHALENGLRPDPRGALLLMVQVLAGLGHAHEHGVVHRDIKPSNVFLPSGRPVKIMDFGIARLAGLGTTTAGTLVGTPNYMSPEQVGGGELDGRSDLFSAGLILYELLTGQKAIQADTVVAALYKILHESPDLTLLPEGQGWSIVRESLVRALARAREDRYLSARAMSDDLCRALLAFGGSIDLSAATDQILVLPRPRPAAAAVRAAPTPPRGLAARDPRAGSSPQRLGWWLGGGLGLLAALTVGLGLLLRPASEPTPTPTTTQPPATQSALPPSPVPTATVVPGTPRPEPSAPAPDEAPPTPQPTPAGSPEERLTRARELLGRARWAAALAEARAVLEADPGRAEASRIAQQAEEELVIEDCLAKARAALRAGDRDLALAEVRRGFVVRKNDERLLAMHREALQQ